MNWGSFIKYSNDQILNIQTGGFMIRHSTKVSDLSQTAKSKGLPDSNCLIVEEAEELTFEEFTQLDDSLRKKGGRMQKIIIFNSGNVTKDHWLVKEYFQNEDKDPDVFKPRELDHVEFIHTTYMDVVDYVNKHMIDKFERVKNEDYERWLSEYGGQFC